MPKYYDTSEVESHFTDLEILEYIASGGFKDVFLVDDQGDEVVLKLLPVERRSTKKRARRESEAMIRTESESFVNLLDYFEDSIEGRDTFVMFEEFIAGETVKETIQGGEYGVEFGLEVMQTLLELLVEFDDKGMIHRDLKPSNLMVDKNGGIRVLDVGIVRFEQKESLTPDHMDRLGTPSYGAPEQLDYDKDLQSIRTDLFSSGIVLFESVTGVHPYKNRGSSVTDAICNGNKADLTEYVDGELGENLGAFFDILTHTEPSKRFRKPAHALERFEEIKEAK